MAPRLAGAGEGAIVNIGSVVGLAPEFGMTVHGATKAFVLFLSQGLSLEPVPRGVYVQAVVPAATRTEIWPRAGIDLNALPLIIEAGELVDAALVGFERREPISGGAMRYPAFRKYRRAARRARGRAAKSEDDRTFVRRGVALSGVVDANNTPMMQQFRRAGGAA